MEKVGDTQRSPPRNHEMSRQVQNKSSSESSQPDGMDPAQWRNQTHLTLLIENIPSHWMVADIKEFLDGFGNVIKIEIFEDREVKCVFSSSI
jgi:hypothetical protein